MIIIEVQAEPDWPADRDWEAIATASVRAAIAASRFPHLGDGDTPLEVSVRLTSDDEVRILNREYREKDKPTNVLSFPMLEPEAIAEIDAMSAPELLLGDIVLAHGICLEEAAERGVALEAHASHLIVHGMLHLLGYDHIEDEDANDMEDVERQAMRALGLHDPYDIEGAR